MHDLTPARISAWAVGLLAVAAGFATFLIPMQHPGPFSMPGRGVVAGLLCLATAALLFAPRMPSAARGVAFACSPLVLFFALYASLAELEEVVVLRAGDADLRLWIVDDGAGTAWVSMSRAKAEDNGLDGARVELLRGGETLCVVPHIVDDDVANRRTYDLRQEKYAVQRLAVGLGLFPDGPGPQTITLRLDPCG
jgi:hypothetical protein